MLCKILSLILTILRKQMITVWVNINQGRKQLTNLRILQKRWRTSIVLFWFRKVLKILIHFTMDFFTPFDISWKKKNKIECGNDDELKKEIDNDQLYDVLSAANGKLRFDLDIQNFKNQCFSVNDLLNKYGLFLRVYELKDKFCYLIKQDSKIYQFSEIYRAVSLKNLMDLTSFVSSSAKVETTFLSNWYNLQAYKKVWWHNKLLFQWEIEHSFLCKF